MSQSRKHRVCDVCGRGDLPEQVGRGNRYKRHVECRPEYRRRSQREAYKTNPTVFKWRTRALGMGITVEQLTEMYDRAGWACEVCGTREVDLEDKYASLAIDHDHRCCPGKRDGTTHRRACGKCVRGLLCPSCNKLLTLADRVTFAAIQEYVRRYEDVSV